MEIYAYARNWKSWRCEFYPIRCIGEPCRTQRIQGRHGAAIRSDDMLTVFYANLDFHQTLFALCGNACLIETIKTLEQKIYGIRFYANASPEALERRGVTT